MAAAQFINFDNSFAALPGGHAVPVAPQPLLGTRLAAVSPEAAGLLDLDAVTVAGEEMSAWLAGRSRWPGTRPVACHYAGHQFGHYVPQLGDGRAILLGEAVNAAGQHWEIQLKGAGTTPFSRDGDGRAVLRSTIREYLCSEAMHGLGVPTTRALCLFDSDEPVYRERIERGAMLVRLAPSHVRFGTFEGLYYRDRHGPLRDLADYVIRHDFPDLHEGPRPFLALLETVIERTAYLIARWQAIGFCHGVMNTDNMSILGLTLDYGPFGFMEAFDPGWICNHSDHHGRYAYDQQPGVALWNLSCLAQALLPLLDADDGEQAAAMAREALARFEPVFTAAHLAHFRDKLGLYEARDGDGELIDDLLALMARNDVDFTNLFRDLGGLSAESTTDHEALLRARFRERGAFDAWLRRYRERLLVEASSDARRKVAMNAVNPRFVLRNYLAERAIRDAEAGDYSEIDRLRRVLAQPFAEQPFAADYAAEPPAWGRELVVSCSS